MSLAPVIKTLGFFVGAVLLSFGAWFIIAPDAALAGTHHKRDTLPFVMGGRYFFFGALLIAALLYQDNTVTAFLLAGFAGLALFDAVLYLDANPVPHFAVGVLAASTGVYFYKTRKPAS